MLFVGAYRYRELLERIISSEAVKMEKRILGKYICTKNSTSLFIYNFFTFPATSLGGFTTKY